MKKVTIIKTITKIIIILCAIFLLFCSCGKKSQDKQKSAMIMTDQSGNRYVVVKSDYYEEDLYHVYPVDWKVDKVEYVIKRDTIMWNINTTR